MAASGQVYRNNILVDNTVGLEVVFGTEAENPVWQNNLVFGNGTDYAGILSQVGTGGTSVPTRCSALPRPATSGLNAHRQRSMPAVR